MSDQNDLHDQIMTTVIEYFRLSEKWEQNRTFRGYYDLQRVTMRLMKLSHLRYKEMKRIHLARSRHHQKLVQRKLDQKKETPED